MGFFFCRVTLTIASMDGDFANQALDMIFDNKSLKRKVRPVLFGSLAFNVLIIALLVLLVFKIHILTGVLRETKLTAI